MVGVHGMVQWKDSALSGIFHAVVFTFSSLEFVHEVRESEVEVEIRQLSGTCSSYDTPGLSHPRLQGSAHARQSGLQGFKALGRATLHSRDTTTRGTIEGSATSGLLAYVIFMFASGISNCGVHTLHRSIQGSRTGRRSSEGQQHVI
jgi:hypothetical protein